VTHGLPVAAVAVSAALVTAQPAHAHGLAKRADLPIPEWLFAWGAALVLVASFAALAVLWPRPVLERMRERVIARVPVALEVLAGVLGVGAFAVTVYAGLAGNQTVAANLAPTTIFVIFWVGIPVLSVLFGDVFTALNPWRATGRAVAWTVGRVRGPLSAPLTYPAQLGRWPAAAGLLAFVWLELVYVNRDDPSQLAVLALVYAAVMLVGMSLYGIEAWTRNADGFTVAFGLYSRLAILHWRDLRIAVRAPLTGAPSMPTGAGAIAVLCVMIGTTSFDGLSQGELWGHGEHGVNQALETAFGGLGADTATQISASIGLLAMCLLVAGLYRVGIAGMRSVGPDHTTADLARRFAHTLIPISLAYVVAHYFSLLAFQGQAIGYLISDPLGDGSDLFGTANGAIDYGVISAAGIWYAQVAALVAGHVAGLALAHDRALTIWSDEQSATRSQLWMLLVMVTFTCGGLYLLSAVAP
jgi:hypothetical protein